MHRYGVKNEKVEFFFLASKWENEPKNNEPEKCDHAEWFPLDNLPENLVPKMKFVLDQYAQGKTFSEYDWA